MREAQECPESAPGVPREHHGSAAGVSRECRRAAVGALREHPGSAARAPERGNSVVRVS